jgi:hypothetical protein
VQLSNRLRKLIVMQNVVLWNAPNRRSQLAQNVSEQTEIDVHMNRFADVFSTWPFEDQSDADRIEMCLKSR